MPKLFFWIILILIADSVLGTVILKYSDPIGFAQKYPLPVLLVTGTILVGMYWFKGDAIKWIMQKR